MCLRKGGSEIGDFQTSNLWLLSVKFGTFFIHITLFVDKHDQLDHSLGGNTVVKKTKFPRNFFTVVSHGNLIP